MYETYRSSNTKGLVIKGETDVETEVTVGRGLKGL